MRRRREPKPPIATGVIDYFPDALLEVALVSWHGNEQHRPGCKMKWDRKKSTKDADSAIRHFVKRGTRDTDKQRHTAKSCWRLLALLQKEIEADRRKRRVKHGPKPRR